jgi:hypothetical protein
METFQVGVAVKDLNFLAGRNGFEYPVDAAASFHVLTCSPFSYILWRHIIPAFEIVEQTTSLTTGAHQASYPMGTRGSFPGGKVARAWSWPLTSI